MELESLHRDRDERALSWPLLLLVAAALLSVSGTIAVSLGWMPLLLTSLVTMTAALAVALMLRTHEGHVLNLKMGALLFRPTLDANPEAVVILDRQGKVIEWNLGAKALLGISRAEATGKLLRSILSANAAMNVDLNTHQKFELSVAGADANQVTCELLCVPLSEGYSIVFLRDLSERKQVETRLLMSNRLETIGRMVAGVAHELNNPLAYVSSNLNFLSSVIAGEKADPEEVKSVIHETLEGTKRIQSLVQDLRIFSRSGEFEALTPIDVEAVLDSVLTVAAHRLTEVSATVSRDFEGVGNVLAIESRLGQVFLNLVVNAAQTMTSSTSNRNIIIATRRQGPNVIVSVRDFGPGISEEIRPHLFSAFFTTKPAGQGTGLGLYISRAIVRGFKGELRAANAVPGAIFEVVLPATSSPSSF